ncbi:MAG: hypothetical protein IPP77_14960 [Bacteroidetes bacterium]|nr:hypothetical protein [Bacteroidota bacterium]
MKKFLLIALVFSGLALVLDACRKPSKPILPEELVLRDRALPVGATGLEIDFAASDFTTGIWFLI